MTPEQIAALTAITSLISQIGTWPIGLILLAVVLGPWIMMGYNSHSMDKRHQAMEEMYKNNVKLVENYEKIAAEQVDTIRLSTASTIELTTLLKTRTRCHELLDGKKWSH